MLEENEYTTFIQAWDIRPGHNFIEKMNEAAKECACTIAVLSQNYIDANYTHPEWQAAFRKDPRGLKRKLIPVRIDDFNIEGLLDSTVYIDLVGREEEEAKKELLNGVSKNAPQRKAPFPGRIKPGKHKGVPTFPGDSINLAFDKLRIGDTSELVGRQKTMTWLEEQLLQKDSILNHSASVLVSNTYHHFQLVGLKGVVDLLIGKMIAFLYALLGGMVRVK